MEFGFRIRQDSEFAMFDYTRLRLHKGIANVKLDHSSYNFLKVLQRMTKFCVKLQSFHIHIPKVKAGQFGGFCSFFQRSLL